MSYISIKQAAERWGLTDRRVQDLCKSGTIDGAVRFGRAWMIPENTERPADGRVKRTEKNADIHMAVGSEGFLLPVPRRNPFLIQTDIYSIPGSADSVISRFASYPETAKILKTQFDYLRGHVDSIYEDAKYYLKEHTGFHSVISAGTLLSQCAIWKGDIDLWRKARKHIYEAPCKTEGDRDTVDFWVAVADSAMHDTHDFPEWFKIGNFDPLHGDSYCTARMFYVKYLMVSAFDLASGKIELKNVQGLGLMRTIPYIVEPMISQAKIEHTLVPEIYMHLIAATAYHNIGDDGKAIPHIDDAIHLCLPDGLFGCLVEYRNYLDSLLDDRLANFDEEALKKVRELHKRMIVGWVKLHNQLLERNVSSTLTLREREVAKLAAFGLSNAEIADRMHIELSSVKRYVFTAMNKVGAEKRTELGLYI